MSWVIDVAQIKLTNFEKKTISPNALWQRDQEADLASRLLDWVVCYNGYKRADFHEEESEGVVKFTVRVMLEQAFIRTWDKRLRKRTTKPGYRIVMCQLVVFPDGDKITLPDEVIQEVGLRYKARAVDAFTREIMNVQCWITIAESRARLIPKKRDWFECPFCGWVTDEESSDVMCQGCGKRFWMEMERHAEENAGVV